MQCECTHDIQLHNDPNESEPTSAKEAAGLRGALPCTLCACVDFHPAALTKGSRLTQVMDVVVDHLDEIGAQVVVMAAEDWPGDQGAHLRSPLGFTTPAPVDDQRSAWVSYVSPELIAEQTAHLSDANFRDYLIAILYCLDVEVSLYDKGFADDSQGRTDKVDADLAEMAPGSLRLMTDVQMAWLDKRNT